MTGHVIEDQSGRIGTITIDRPEKLNALTKEINESLRDSFDSFSDVDAIILQSAGDDAFVAGADLNEIKGLSSQEFAEYQRFARTTNDTIADHAAAVIAAVDGPALGGGFELALAADMIVAEESATFALPEVSLGLVPGGGATQRLPRVVGPNKAKEMITTGEPIDATEAYRLGLVNRLADDESAVETAKSLVEEISANAPLAIREGMRLVDEGFEAPLKTALSYEQEVTFSLYETRDAKEGIEAFHEDRTPEFNGH